MTSKQPKQGNVKLTISIKTETRNKLQQQAKNKHAIGQIIDALYTEKTCNCGATAIFQNLDTHQNLCAKCSVPEVKKALAKLEEPKQ